MKKYLIAFILLGWQLTVSAQQQGKSPEQRAQNFSTKLSRDLALTDEQKNKIYTIALSNFTEMQNARNSQAGDKQNQSGELKDVRKKMNDEVRLVLTPQQITQWEQLKAEKKGKKNNYRSN